MLLKTSFLLPHLFWNVEFDFTWFQNNQTVVRDFNSQIEMLEFQDKKNIKIIGF